MSKAKTIQLFLIDGKADGRIKCTLANWTGLTYKIPRNMLREARSIEALDQTGVYILFGVDEETGTDVAYIGQAGIRKNGKGVLGRLEEHVRDKSKSYWTHAVILTTSNDSFGPTEISYLEHRLTQIATDAGRYRIQNGNDPNQGNVTEEKQAELEEFLEFSRLTLGSLGYQILEPILAPSIDSLSFGSTPDVSKGYKELEIADSSDQYAVKPEALSGLLRMTTRNSSAKGKLTNEGFVILAGARISPTETPSCPLSVRQYRKKYAEWVTADNVTQRDLLFSSPSSAGGFVAGRSVNGKEVWISEKGERLADLA